MTILIKFGLLISRFVNNNNVHILFIWIAGQPKTVQNRVQNEITDIPTQKMIP